MNVTKNNKIKEKKNNMAFKFPKPNDNVTKTVLELFPSYKTIENVKFSLAYFEKHYSFVCIINGDIKHLSIEKTPESSNMTAEELITLFMSAL